MFYSIESLFRINQSKQRWWFLSAFLLCVLGLPRARRFCSASSLVTADLSSAVHSTLYVFTFFILLKIQVFVRLRECLFTISGTLPAASWCNAAGPLLDIYLTETTQYITGLQQMRPQAEWNPHGCPVGLSRCFQNSQFLCLPE